MTFKVSNKPTREKPFAVENEKRYNGWNNFLTWQVALNIDNDRGMYEMNNEAFENGEITDGESYKNWFKQTLEDSGNYSEDYHAFKISDSWTDRELEEVDWDELYESHKREMEENKRYQNQ